MKLGVCVLYYGMDGIEEKIKKVRDHGFGSCQLLCWREEAFTDENASALKKILDENNVEISALWCGWAGPCVWNFYEGQKTLGLVPPDLRDARVKTLCNGGDFAKKLGVTDVVTHMGFIPENPYDHEFEPFCDAVRVVAEHLKSNGQNLLFETGQETPVTMLRCFETVGMDNLYVNLDTANLILYGKANPVDSLDVYGKYVRNLHAKDGFYPTNGHELGREVRLGEGKVDFRTFFKRLSEFGYDRYVTIEREIDGDEQERDIAYAKKYLTEIIEEVYGGNALC